MYLSNYDKISFYHPEEGGYYSEGQVLYSACPVPHGKGRREIRKVYRRLCQQYGKRNCYIAEDGRSCGYRGSHYGDGEKYILESNNHVGKNEKGNTPYC